MDSDLTLLHARCGMYSLELCNNQMDKYGQERMKMHCLAQTYLYLLHVCSGKLVPVVERN